MDKAQAAMLNRVSLEIDRYADSIKADEALVSYCRTEMRMHTSSDAARATFPYAVNYTTIRDAGELDTVLLVREQFEISYLKLCLAKAKATLREAENSREK